MIYLILFRWNIDILIRGNYNNVNFKIDINIDEAINNGIDIVIVKKLIMIVIVHVIMHVKWL